MCTACVEFDQVPPSQPDVGDHGANPFAAPASSLPEAFSMAWHRYAVTAGGLLAAIMICDAAAAVGLIWLAIVSYGARMMLFLLGGGFLLMGLPLLLTGRPHTGREWVATGMLFVGVVVASGPSFLLLAWLQ